MDVEVTKYFDFNGITDDGEFVSRFFKCRESMDHSWGERRGFRPEDVDHVTDILEKQLSGLCETFGLDKDLVLAGVDKAIELYREEDEKAPEGFREMDRSNDFTGERWRIMNLAYNAAFGFYLAKRLDRRCLLEVKSLNLHDMDIYVLSKNGIRLITVKMDQIFGTGFTRPCQLNFVIGPGQVRTLDFGRNDTPIPEQLKAFDFDEIFTMAEFAVEDSGKNVVDTVVSMLREIKYELKSEQDVVDYIDSNDICPEYDRNRIDEHDLSVMERMFLYASNYVIHRYDCTHSNMCYANDRGDYCFEYSEWNMAYSDIPPLATGRGYSLCPYYDSSESYDSFRNKFTFKFGVVNGTFEIYIMGIALRTSAIRGVETMLKLDFKTLFDRVESFVNKACMDKTNIDNLIDLETSL